MTAVQARELIREVQETLDKGERVEVEKLVESRLARKVQEIPKATRSLQEVTERLLTLRRAEIELVGADTDLRAAKGFLDEGRVTDAEGVLDSLRETTEALLANVRESTQGMLARAEAQIQAAAQVGFDTNSIARMLQAARAHFDEGRLPEAIEMAKSAEAAANTAIGEWEAARRREQQEQERGTQERAHRIQERLTNALEECHVLSSAGIDATPATEMLANVTPAVERSEIGEAEKALASAESVLGSLWAALRREGQNLLERAHRQTEDAERGGLVTPEAKMLLQEAMRAFEDKQYKIAVELSEAYITALEQARQQRAAEQTRLAEERARTAREQMERVRTLLAQVKAAMGDSGDGSEAIDEAERTLEGVVSRDLETQLTEVERVAERLQVRLRESASTALQQAEQAIADAAKIAADTDDAQLELETGQELFAKGDFEGASRHARGAERRARQAEGRRRGDLDAERKRRAEVAKVMILKMKATVEDLGRADIQMEGGLDSVNRAYRAWEEGRYEEVESVLEPFQELAASLTEGLRSAAETFLQREQMAIVTAKTEGLEVPRAEKVLATAQAAVKQEKFVEALEYHKVIDDIITDARRQKDLGRMTAQLEALREELARGLPEGKEVEVRDFLEVAQEHLKRGSFEQFRTELKKAQQVMDTARHAIVDARLQAMEREVASTRELGAEVTEAEQLLDEARRCASLGDLAALTDLGKRIAEIADGARRKFLRSRSVKALRDVRDSVEDAGHAGVNIAEANTLLRKAEEALNEGAYDRLAATLEQARELVARARHEHFTEVFGERLQALQATVSEAEHAGIESSAAYAHLTVASRAIGAGDFETADLALQRAQLETGREIQRWLGTKHPELVVDVQREGLQEGRWNSVQVTVENRGSVAARDVRLAVDGDAEVAGAEPIPSLEAGAKATLSLGVRPKGSGEVPLNVVATYHRVFDDADYETAAGTTVAVEEPGTYVVEDVFMIHVDGRLLCHVGGTYRQVDEDIFSGMLSVVQDFVRDAFNTRSGKGLRRFEFGTNGILIERASHLFVAVMVAGREPELLPLYMAETLQEAEAKFGSVLENWGGLLHEVAGIEDLARRLLMVTDTAEAPLGALADSPVTQALRAMQRAREVGAEDPELEQLLAKAKSPAEGDLEITWKFLSKAGDVTKQAEARVDAHMAGVVKETSTVVGELRRLGADVGQAGLLLREAEAALAERNFQRVRQIGDSLKESLDIARLETAAKGLQAELQSLLEDLERCKAQHLNVSEVEGVLVTVQESIAGNDAAKAQGLLRRAREMLQEEKVKSASQHIQERLAALAKLLLDASTEGLPMPEVQDLLDKATAAFTEGREGDARVLLGMVEENVRPKIQKFLTDRFPRIFVTLSRQSFQVGEAAKCEIDLENRGTSVATDVELDLSGEFDFGPVRKVGRLPPGERRTVVFRATPREEGYAVLDARLRFQRPLDETVHTVMESKEVAVHPAATYRVERAFLFDASRKPIATDARILVEKGDKLLAEVHRRLASSFTRDEDPSFLRIPLDGRGLLLQRGAGRFLAVVCSGEEPSVLPLFMVDALRAASQPDGDPAREVSKLLWVSEYLDADLGPLEDSPLLSAVIVAGGSTDDHFLQRARGVIEQLDFDAAVKFLSRAEETTVVSREELRDQLNSVLFAGGETAAMSEEEIGKIIDMIKQIITAVQGGKKGLGIHPRWPVRRVAVVPADNDAYEMVTSFKKILAAQTVSRDFEVLKPGETWRGMDLELVFHPEQMNRIYKSWARRVELMLKKQDPWKIKAGIDRGEYSVGIEGQKVMVRHEAVSFTISLPKTCSEETFPAGVVYVDGASDEDLAAEGKARELVAAIREARDKAGVPAADSVEAAVEADDELVATVRPWLKLLQDEAKAAAVTFGKVKKGTEHSVAGGKVRVAVASRGKA
ncbi:MAG TPA: CARDB domain-containing protein [Thermoplasmata archaeon]|nr:CARDB domain-containing protein [Thermoplasmata archaeon]